MFNSYYHKLLKSTSVIPAINGFPNRKSMEEKGWTWIAEYSNTEVAQKDANDVLEEFIIHENTNDNDIPDWIIEEQISELLGK